MRRAICLGAFAAASSLLIGSALAFQPMKLCRVSAFDRHFVFSFISHDYRLSDRLKTQPFGIAANSIELWRLDGDSAGLVWGIQIEQGPPVRSITYGEVPDGYKQYYPSGGRPEPLQVGGQYRLGCDLGLLRFEVTDKGVKNLDDGEPD